MAKDYERMEDSDHIIQWTEDGDFDASTFRWKHLLLAGNPANARPEARGDIRGDIFANPDGLTLDERTMFVNIQHPGEPLKLRRDGMELPNLHSDLAEPARYSNWPDFKPGGRSRSATVAIRKANGGPIGT